MAVTIAAAWCVASTHASRRRLGFWLFLASNVLWIAWGWFAGAVGADPCCRSRSPSSTCAVPASRPAQPGGG
jgi:hypothetical protein